MMVYITLGKFEASFTVLALQIKVVWDKLGERCPSSNLGRFPPTTWVRPNS